MGNKESKFDACSNADLRRQLQQSEQELEAAVQRREEALALEASAKDEIQKHLRMATDANEKYQRELRLHAADKEFQGCKRGDHVKIDHSIRVVKAMQKGHGGWAPEMLKVVFRVGIVIGIDDDDDVVVEYPTAGKFTFSPLVLKTTKENVEVPSTPKIGTLHPGDLVYIIDDPAEMKRLQDNHGGWVDTMVNCAGKVAYVKKIVRGKLRLRVGDDSWWFNPKATVEISELELLAHKEEYQDERHFHVGDIVQLATDERRVRRLQDGHGEWVANMRSALGLFGYVKKVYDDDDAHVRFGEDSWTVNPEVLTKVVQCQSENDDETVEDHLLTLLSVMRELGDDDDDDDGDGKLLQAVKEGDDQTVDELIREGANVNYVVDGHSVLDVASHLGHIEQIRILCVHGADLDKCDNDGDFAIHLAALANKSTAILTLIEEGANSNVQNKKGQTPLHMAAQKGYIEAVQTLLNAGAPIDMQDNMGDTPLHDAIHCHQSAIVDLLLSYDANVKLINGSGFNPIHLAARRGEFACIRSIINHLRHTKQLEVMNVKKEDGFSALHLAAYNGHQEIVSLLIDQAGASRDIRNNKQQTPLHLAADKLYIEVVQILVKSGCNVNAEDDVGDTPLHETLRRHTMYSVQVIREIADALEGLGNNKDPKIAEKIAVFLALKGADLNHFNNKKQTPLDLCRDEDMVAQLVSSSIDWIENNPGAVGGDEFLPERRAMTDDVAKNVAVDTSESRVMGMSPNLDEYSRASSKMSKNQHVKRLEEQLQELQRVAGCPICLTEPRNIIFNCGHGCCKECSDKINQCPLCNERITQRIKIY